MRLLESIWLDRDGKLTLQEQLVLQIKQYVQQGRLSPGEAMPSFCARIAKLSTLMVLSRAPALA